MFKTGSYTAARCRIIRKKTYPAQNYGDREQIGLAFARSFGLFCNVKYKNLFKEVKNKMKKQKNIALQKLEISQSGGGKADQSIQS